jgi:6-phosphogluconolactonase (cycloisomerase 2 family)
MERGPRWITRVQCVSLFFSVSLLILLSSCGGGGTTGAATPSPTPQVSLTSIAVGPTAPTIALGTTQQFTATGHYSDGSTKDLTSTATWSSSATNVATIAASGLATSAAQGTTTISAVSASITGSTTLTVVPPPASLTTITVSPAEPSIALGLTQQFSAKGTFSDGSTKDLSASATWSSSPTGIATISSSGLASSTSQGATTVSATLAGVTGSATLTVGPPQLTGITVSPAFSYVSKGSSQPFTATGTYTDASTQNLSSTVTWTISNSYVAQGAVTTTPSLAFVATPLLNGVAIISANTGSFSAAAKLAVTSVPRFALTSDEGGNSVSTYIVDQSKGDLHMRGYTNTRYQADTPFTDCVTTDPSVTYAYVFDAEFPSANPPETGNVRIYKINSATGGLTEISGSPFATGVGLNCIQFEPSGRFGYALGFYDGGNILKGYSRDSGSGQLTELSSWSPMTVGNDPVGLAIDPLGQYLYFVNAEITSGKPTSIAGYAIDPSTGALTAIKGMPISVANTTTAVAIEPLGNYAYVSHGGGNTVDQYKIDRSTGTLTLVPGSTITTDINPSALVFSADGAHAYVSALLSKLGDVTSGTIASLNVDSASGKLTQTGKVAAGTTPGALTIDPSGQFVYSSENYSYVHVHKIQADGTLKFVRSIETRQGPLSIAFLGGSSAVSYKPASVFVTTTGEGLIAGYTVQSDGSLQMGSSAATPAGPISIAVLPWGTQALVAASGAPAGSNLGTYSVNPATGTPTLESFTGNAVVAAGAAIDPSGLYGFQSDSSSAVVRTYGYTNMWGLVTYLGSGGPYSTFPAGAGAGPMTMVPSGRYLYVANQGANSISAFAFWGELFEETAAYTSPYADGSPYAIGAEPIAVAADPMGLYLYVVCGDNTVRVYSIDSWSGGHLKQVAIANLTAAPTAVAVDPTGHFVYVGDASGNVAPFGVDTGSGALTPLTPSVLPAAVASLTLESSGQFAYVLCGPVGGAGGNNGSINAFKVNADGTLTGLSAGPWLANQPSAIAFTDSVQ